MNFCVDCLHCAPGVEPELTARCYRKVPRNPVTGKPDFTFCSVERVGNSSEDYCGADAKFFEPKEGK